SFVSHSDSIRGDLENICLRAGEKLKQSALDSINNLREQVNAYKLDLLSTSKSLNSSVLIPNLREHISQLKGTAHDLKAQFVQHIADTTTQQISELESRYTTIAQELDQLVERLSLELEQTFPAHELKLTEAGGAAEKKIEESITNLSTLFEETEKQISQITLQSSQLAETDSKTTASDVLAEQEASRTYLQKLKDEASEKLNSQIQSHISCLEKEGQQAQLALSTSRDKHVQLVAQTANNAVEQIKEALKEAFQAIQVEGSKYLE
ncbi:MAG: hypothetical protein HY711_02870, partial [Candidatus Melainabacteria bacterium]|nr:hypothetical protein [Candidatus Melainabacteria bacterium]